MNIADINGDGRMDIVSVSSHIGDTTYTYGGIIIYINTGKGIFVPEAIDKIFGSIPKSEIIFANGPFIACPWIIGEIAIFLAIDSTIASFTN